MGSVFAVMAVAIIVLWILFRDAVADARYWQEEDQRHWDMLNRAWDRERELMKWQELCSNCEQLCDSADLDDEGYCACCREETNHA